MKNKLKYLKEIINFIYLLFVGFWIMMVTLTCASYLLSNVIVSGEDRWIRWIPITFLLSGIFVLVRIGLKGSQASGTQSPDNDDKQG